MSSRFNEFIVIGLGGIGGYLLHPLFSYIRSTEELPKRVSLVDGDKVERKNLGRQFFTEADVGLNKAEAWCKKLSNSNISVVPRPHFLTGSNATQFISTGSIVFSCVDNHFTRRLIHDAAKICPDILVISGGNEFSDGNVQIYERAGGKDQLPPIIKYHAEIEFPEDKSPEDMSCEELSRAEPQLIFTNLEAASQMLSAFWRRIVHSSKFCEVNFDLMGGTSVPSIRS